MIIPPSLDYLWRYVLGSAAHGIGELVFAETDLRKPEVSELDVSVFVYEDVFGLQITVDDISLMKVFESEKDFGRVKLSDTFRKLLVSSQQVEQFSLHRISDTPDIRSTRR